MIDGAHIVIYSKNADADKAFIRDVLKFKYVDAHDGWLIFRLPSNLLKLLIFFNPILMAISFNWLRLTILLRISVRKPSSL